MVDSDKDELRKTYARMPLAQLRELNANRTMLTPDAKIVLDAELSSRNTVSVQPDEEDLSSKQRLLGGQSHIRVASPAENRNRFIAFGLSLVAPGLAFAVFYFMVSYRIGNGRLMSSAICAILGLGAAAAIFVVRRSKRLAIRIVGSFIAAIQLIYAVIFLWAATVGVG